MSREMYVAELRAAGHFHGMIIHQDNDRFRVVCECGYRSTTRTSVRLALEAIEHHRGKVLAEFRRNGVSVLPRVGAIL